MTFLLDIGGEGRHADAWNLNPSPIKTLGPLRGESIPRYIPGRADAIPFPDHSVPRIIVERTPLSKSALRELGRVIADHGTIVLRHAMPPKIDPHLLARAILPGRVTQRRVQIGRQTLQETCFRIGAGDHGNDIGS